MGEDYDGEWLAGWAYPWPWAQTMAGAAGDLYLGTVVVLLLVSLWIAYCQLRRGRRTRPALYEMCILPQDTPCNKHTIKRIAQCRHCSNLISTFLLIDSMWPMDTIYDIEALVRFGSLCVYNALVTFPGKSEKERYGNGKTTFVTMMRDYPGSVLHEKELEVAFQSTYDVHKHFVATPDSSDGGFFSILEEEQGNTKELIKILRHITLASLVIHFLCLKRLWVGPENEMDSEGRLVYSTFGMDHRSWPTGEECEDDGERMTEMIRRTVEKVCRRAENLPLPPTSVISDKRIITALSLISVAKRLLTDIKVFSPESLKYMPAESSSEIQNMSTSMKFAAALLAREIAAVVMYDSGKHIAHVTFNKRGIVLFKHATPQKNELESKLSRVAVGYRRFNWLQEMFEITNSIHGGRKDFVLAVKESETEEASVDELCSLRDHLLPSQYDYYHFEALV